jgi:exosortase
VRAVAQRAVLPFGVGLPIVVSGFIAIVAMLYSTIVHDLVAQWWDDPNYSHGFLVPFFSVFLIWLRKDELASREREGTWLGLPVLVLGVAMLLLGDVGAELFLMRSSVIVVLAGLILLHFGVGVFRMTAFALAFLFFMIPLPAIVLYAVTFPLQSLAAQNAAWALELLGVPVLLDGNVIHLSQISLGVTEACSGIRSLVSLVALAVGLAYLTLTSPWKRALLVAATLPFAIIANAGRVIATAFTGLWFGPDYAQGFFHGLSGWTIFVFASACLLALDHVLLITRRAPRRHGD